MKRPLKLTVQINAAERANLERVQRELAERGTRASLSSIALACMRQALPHIATADAK